MHDDHFAATRNGAAQLAGISLRQLDYWAATDLIRPHVERRLTPGRKTALYDLGELTAVLVVAEIRRRHAVPLQQVRRVVEHLRDRLQIDAPLREVRFAVVNRHLFFQLPDGSWEGGRRPGQEVIPDVLDLTEIRARIAGAAVRRREDFGRIERRRGAKGSKPLFAGTRIPVSVVRSYLAAGRSEADILAAYPDLGPADVEAALTA